MIHLLPALAANPSLPSHLVDHLISRADARPDPAGRLPDDRVEELAESLADRADLSPAQVRALAAHHEHTAVQLAYGGKLRAADVDPSGSPYAALALLDEGRGLAQWTRLLATVPDPHLRWKLASCPGLPPDVTDALSADPDVEVVAELALWTTSGIAAARLALHPDRRVRRATVANPATPAEAVVALAEESELSLNWLLAERTDLPQALYARLAADPLPGVRAALARNAGIGEDLIRVLAHDPDHDVRRSLAHHPRVPLDVLTQVAGETGIGPTLLPRIASATPDELAELTASAHAAVRMLVAERRDLPPELRDALATDQDAAVVRAVAPHPGLSEERLRAMVAQHGVRVLARAAANPDAPGGLLADLARHEPPVRKALSAIAVHPNATAEALLPCLADPKAARHAAAHPALAPSVLLGLLTGADEEVARAAATNPALSRAVMEEWVTASGG